MDFQYGKRSLAKLHTCRSELIAVADLALQRSPYDITIIHGWRGEELQNALFDSGASRKHWPNSAHNTTDDQVPASDALDFGPWVNNRVPWDDTHIFALVAGCFMAAADELSVRLRWGGDWDGDGSTKDQTLLDWGHLQVVESSSTRH